MNLSRLWSRGLHLKRPITAGTSKICAEICAGDSGGLLIIGESEICYLSETVRTALRCREIVYDLIFQN